MIQKIIRRNKTDSSDDGWAEDASESRTVAHEHFKNDKRVLLS